MSKIKRLVVSIVISILILGGGVICFNNSKDIKQDTKILSQSSNKIQKELVNRLKDTKKIQVYHNYHEENLDNIKPVTITDKDIISDFIDLLSVTHKNKSKDMGGGSVNNQKLVFILDNGNIEIYYTYDSLYEIGYINYNGQTIDLPYDFFRLISNVEMYSPKKSSIPRDVEQLFEKYNWTPSFLVNKYKYLLPNDLIYAPEKGIDEIYWAYNLQFSKSIGLDFSNLLGKEIEVEVYYLLEEMPKFTQPIVDTTAVILRYNGNIVGSYIDSGILNRAISSLNRQSFKEITGDNIEDFIIKKHINENSKLNKEMSKKSNEELIKIYYDSMYNKDVVTHLSTLDIGKILNYMDTYPNNKRLFNDINFEDELFANSNETEVLEVKEDDVENGQLKNFRVKINIKESNNIIQEKGIYDVVIVMRKNENGTYKVISVGF
ncbi:DUF4830 domain-containing protein [Clostridium sp. CCUG 7971]|uniref:DUF4830 domain-containing protein n=1 Tax=Clostridium sp. CCUG 7971 TaxID=2811414 RepID=UPI001ABACDA1|nr:DUF4830 domain-containing protein [Clostridium sp. CCUG 7971]MBO3446063.1 DUF4830 domain-containing protein [Clostridium sp. CCUG 7971]